MEMKLSVKVMAENFRIGLISEAVMENWKERAEALERVMRGDCRYCKHVGIKSNLEPCRRCELPHWKSWELNMDAVYKGIAEKEKAGYYQQNSLKT